MARTALLAVAIALVAAPAARAAAPYADRVLVTPGLAGYWSLDERAGPVAADLRTTGAGLHGGAVRAGTGPLVGDGRSARYDGRRAATAVPNSPRLNPTRAVSIEAWVRPDALRHAATVAGKPGQYALGFTRDGAAVARLWHAGGIARLSTAPGAVAAGRTTHLVATFDGTAQHLYVDGRERARRTLRGRLDKHPTALVLGGGLAGRLDEVALYDGALDAATVRAHTAAGRATGCATRPLRIGLGAAWRPPCWRPFRAGGAFGQPLRPGAPVAPDSASIVARLAGQGGPRMIYGLPAATSDPAFAPADFQHPVYTATWLDGSTRVRCVRYVCPELHGGRVPLPPGARPAGAGDAHLGVVDEDTGGEYDLWQARPGRTLRASGGGTTSPDDGLDWGLGSGATAAHFALSAGVVRAPELAAGEIDHALFLAVNCTRGFVAPARGLGAQCPGGPPMGARLRLDMSDREIAALRVPAWKRGVLRALARYGGYVGDTGASDESAFDVALESGETYTSLRGPDLIGDLWARVDGETRYENYRYFDVASGVDWRGRLRVVDPCVAARTC
jgi:hypothetical protein